MPHATVFAIGRGLVIEPQAMADSKGKLVKVCWTEAGKRREFADTGFWWMRFGKQSLRIAAPFPQGANVDIHWE